MKQAASLYQSFSTDLKAAYETHPAFAGRKVRYKVAVTLFVITALSIISYSSTCLFS
ncbi:MAG TPA: hypothetical protein VGE66_02750 [Chitinophagaceae bacterium]